MTDDIREIVLDTETTGLDPLSGDRVAEIGAVELVNHLPTGRTYHQYINPERSMPIEAFNVHGLDDAFLADQPVFHEIADGFEEFIGDAKLVIHNASFDIKFLDFELVRLRRPALTMARAIDTLALARRKFPGSPANLDALCRRFDVDTSVRVKHGALIDCELLAEVYLHLIGGRQPDLGLAANRSSEGPLLKKAKPRREPRPHSASPAELDAHAAFLDSLTDPIWRRAD